MFPNDGRNPVHFRLPESVVVCHANGCEPELREFSVSLDMNVWRLVSVAREEEKPIRATLQDSRTHRNDSASFSDWLPILLFRSG